MSVDEIIAHLPALTAADRERLSEALARLDAARRVQVRQARELGLATPGGQAEARHQVSEAGPAAPLSGNPLAILVPGGGRAAVSAARWAAIMAQVEDDLANGWVVGDGEPLADRIDELLYGGAW